MPPAPLPSVQTIDDVQLKENPRCSPSQYACLLAVLQKKQEQMSPRDLATFFSLFDVPNPGAQGDQAQMVDLANKVRKVLKGEARDQQSWGLACQTFVNGDKQVTDLLDDDVSATVVVVAAPEETEQDEPAATNDDETEEVDELDADEHVQELDADEHVQQPDEKEVTETNPEPAPEPEPEPEPAADDTPVEESQDVVDEDGGNNEAPPPSDDGKGPLKRRMSSKFSDRLSDMQVKLEAEKVPWECKPQNVGKVDGEKISGWVNAFKPKEEGTRTSSQGPPPQIEIPRGPEVEYVSKPEDDIDSDAEGAAEETTDNKDSNNFPAAAAPVVAAGPEPKPEPEVEEPAYQPDPNRFAKPVDPNAPEIAARSSDGAYDDDSWMTAYQSTDKDGVPRHLAVKSQFEERDIKRQQEIDAIRNKINTTRKASPKKLQPDVFQPRPQFVFECAFKALEAGCKDLQTKAKKLGKTAVAITIARGVFDDIQYLYSRQYSAEMISGIKNVQNGTKTTASVKAAVLSKTYQAVHASGAGMITEFDRAAQGSHDAIDALQEVIPAWTQELISLLHGTKTALDECVPKLAPTPQAQAQYFGQILTNKDGLEPRALRIVIKSTGMSKSQDDAHHYCAALKRMTTADEYVALQPVLSKELKPVWNHVNNLVN